jgi:hypothetical protein
MRVVENSSRALCEHPPKGTKAVTIRLIDRSIRV